MSTKFVDTASHTILNARRLWEVFGQRQDEVAFIPQSGGAGTLTNQEQG